jgi:hypothetical protein
MFSRVRTQRAKSCVELIWKNLHGSMGRLKELQIFVKYYGLDIYEFLSDEPIFFDAQCGYGKCIRTPDDSPHVWLLRHALGKQDVG